MKLSSPPHPGRLIRQECLDPHGLSVTEAARLLRVTRQALSNVINGHSAISPEMAVRLSKAFGGAPDAWLRMQMAHDLARAEKMKIDIKAVSPLPYKVGFFSPADRAAEKRKSRAEDEARLLSGEVSPHRISQDNSMVRRLKNAKVLLRSPPG